MQNGQVLKYPDKRGLRGCAFGQVREARLVLQRGQFARTSSAKSDRVLLEPK